MSPALWCGLAFALTGNEHMLLYRAYLLEDGHVQTAIDLVCTDDEEAKQQSENLSGDGISSFGRATAGSRFSTALRSKRKMVSRQR